MFSNKIAVWVAKTLSCLLIVSTPVWVANAQAEQDRPSQTGPDTPGSKFESCEYQLNLCQGFRKGLSDKVKALEAQIKALEAQIKALEQQIAALEQQIAALEQKAALPVCWNKTVWKHPTIPWIDCSPFACGAKPYSCTGPCESLQDCPPGLVCDADGQCIPPPKDDPPEDDGGL